MQKIIPHLWFDKQAKEAAKFYTSSIPDSKITRISTLQATPSGDTDIVSFELSKQKFMAISAGPLFKFNPSVSFHIKCKTTAEVDQIWEKFSKGANILMELGEYPFSQRYGWLADKYGLSWQIIHTDIPFTQKIVPVMMFVGKMAGRAEEAINFYTSVFKQAKTNFITRRGKGEAPDKEGSVKYAQFSLFGQEFGIMDSAHDHKFAFNEAISFIVNCENQQEIDYYWEKISFVPESEQCGWIKDKFGVSWQIVPTAMEEMLNDPDQQKLARVTQAFLQMKKFDLAALQKAYHGK